MSVYDILKKRKYVLDYETHAEIDKELIIDLLQKAWKVTPSKNNFMPYKVHVIGPERRKLKESIFLKSLKHEGAADNIDVIERYEKLKAWSKEIAAKGDGYKKVFGNWEHWYQRRIDAIKKKLGEETA